MKSRITDMFKFVANSVNRKVPPETLDLPAISVGVESEPTSPVAIDLPADCIDHEAMAVLTDDLGPDDVKTIIAMFIKETQARLIRLGEFVAHADTVKREIHSLKGAASNVCARELSEAAAVVEARLRSGGLLEQADLSTLSRLFDRYHAAIAPAVA